MDATQPMIQSQDRPSEYTSILASKTQSYQAISSPTSQDLNDEQTSKTNLKLARFLSDFTLGFSDGLTVPFALTAGLSSLGRAETVIYAGLAELCAGSISMGIGGYLAALDDQRACENKEKKTFGDDPEEARGLLSATGDENKQAQCTDEEAVLRHLQPLNLPQDMVSNILTTLSTRKGGLEHARSIILPPPREDTAIEEIPPVWPVGSGLSISIGYIVGGLIPLLPYFVAPDVGTGLCWSIGLCLVALFGFGFGKCWMLSEDRHLRQSLIEGFRMLILGSLAAVASVLCIKLLEGSTSPQ